MKRSMQSVLTLMVFGLLVAGLQAGQVLNGIPGGDFNSDFATGKPSQSYPGGTWSYYQDTNGHADIVGEGDARHLELYSGWDYNGPVSVTFTSTAPTPTDSPWIISADMWRMDSPYNADNTRLFALRKGTTTVMSMDFSLLSAEGYVIDWVAGSESGTFLSVASIFGQYRTVAFSYDPLTGAVKGTCGSETVFETTLAGGLTVDNLYFYHRMFGATTGGYDSSRVAIDNIRGIIPLMTLMEGRSGTLYTDAAGISSAQVLFTEPAVFTASDVVVTDSSAAPVAFSVSGSGTDIMTITFTEPLQYGVYSVELQDSIVAQADGTPLYTGSNGSGGTPPAILGGIPGGDFSRDTLLVSYGEGIYWSSHTTDNAFITLEPDGGAPEPSNYVRLRTEWYDRSANYWFVYSPSATPLNMAWGVAADVMNIPGGYEGNDRIFGLRTIISVGVFTEYAFSMNFNYLNNWIDWVAGSQSGRTTFPAGLSKAWTTAAIEYNPNTGQAVGKFGEAVVFDVSTETGLSADTVFFSNRDQVAPQDTGSFNIDNITSYVVEETEPNMNAFELEHRRQMDLTNDNAVDLDDFSQFANEWMN